MPWEISSERSVYLQLMEIIKQKIMSGEYAPGQKLDSVRDLAADAEVNPNTMQKALSELEREGLLYTQRTNGRFVTEDEAMIKQVKKHGAILKTRDFYASMRQGGFSAQEIQQLVLLVMKEEEAGKTSEMEDL